MPSHRHARQRAISELLRMPARRGAEVRVDGILIYEHHRPGPAP